nr:xylulose kinase-1 [Tanacetum cinerariifolium]
MTFTFVKTHNIIAYLSKLDASEWCNQIIDILYESSIKYALTVNPNIYVSCIKQFWTSVIVKKVNDIMRLQALVDKKKVVITEATLRDALRLDDAEGIEWCRGWNRWFFNSSRNFIIRALTSPSATTPTTGIPSSCTSSASSLTCCSTIIPSKSGVSTLENPLPTLFMLANTLWVKAGEEYFVMTADAIDELNSFHDVRLALIH